jgi:hypothetical protein
MDNRLQEMLDHHEIIKTLNQYCNACDRCDEPRMADVDNLERDGDRWRIRRRHVVRDWTISLPLEHDWVGALALTPGARSNEDPCFAALNLIHSQLSGSTAA